MTYLVYTNEHQLTIDADYLLFYKNLDYIRTKHYIKIPVEDFTKLEQLNYDLCLSTWRK